MSVETIAEALLDKLKHIAKAETIIGEPISSGDSLIIPVNRIYVGMGMGGHTGKSEVATSGGGLKIDPVAFLVLRGDDIRVMPINREYTMLGKIAEIAPDAIGLLINLLKEKKYDTEIKKE